MRKTIIFGNGLGMALSPGAFSLDAALEEVWDDRNALTDGQRQLIRACLPDDTEFDRPSSEDDLDLIQRVLAACDFLDGIQIPGGVGDHWLSAHGQQFPAAIRKFVYKVACKFHENEEILPDEFSENLTEFISETKSHVCTLNYDALIYDLFVRRGVLNGYNGDLIDGIRRLGFQREYLRRNDPNKLGWYLHLHGTPLYYDGQNGRVRKMRRCDFGLDEVESSHIVLTHVKHKAAIIQGSKILSEYWRFFRKALRESEEIILFGYSGYDVHLNEVISQYTLDRPIKVVEWSGSQPNNDREGFWLERLKRAPVLMPFDNILEFDAW